MSLLDPSEWNEDYILNLPIGEFDWLEIKGRRGLDLTLEQVKEHAIKANLSKAISAFANSGGGNLVFGLCDPKGSWQVDDGGIALAVKTPNTREWLEDIIPTLVDNPLRSFNVYVIQGASEHSQIADGRGIFVIQIHDSEQAPHQANDNIYYARVGGKSRPINHRFVSDIFNRRQHPTIQLEFEIRSTKHYPTKSLSNLTQPFPSYTRHKPEKTTYYELVVHAKNVGRVYAQYVNCVIDMPSVLIPEEQREYSPYDLQIIDNVEYVSWEKRNTQRDFIKSGSGFGNNEYGPSRYDPILPGLSYSWDWYITSNFLELDLTTLKIRWQVYADNATMQVGEVMLKDVELFHLEYDQT